MIFGKPEATAGAVGSTTNSNPAVVPAASAGAAAAAAHPADRPAINIRYVDRPDAPETFADSITGLFFDGQTLRIEFAVTRVDEVKANAPVSGRRYPVCRVVLPPSAAVELINRV